MKMPAKSNYWHLATVVTSLLCVAVALAPLMGLIPVAVISALWFLACGLAISSSGINLFQSPRPTEMIAVVGVGLATLRMISLGVVRVFDDRPALFWNVDWRYHMTHALGISRFDGAGNSLEYADGQLVYHAGPSWIAGSLDRYLGVPSSVTLFLLVPLLVVPMIAYWSVLLLRTFGLKRDAALLAIAVAFNFPDHPSFFWGWLRSPGDGIFGVDNFWFTSSLMLNSLLALVPLLSGLSLLLGHASSRRLQIAGCSMLASLVGLKPQFFITAVSILAVAAVVELWFTRRERVSTSSLAVSTAFIIAAGLLLLRVLPTTDTFERITLQAPSVPPMQSTSGAVWMWSAAITAISIAASRMKTPVFNCQRTISVVASAVLTSVLLDASVVLTSKVLVDRAELAGFRLDPTNADWNFLQALQPLLLLLSMLAFGILFGLIALARPQLQRAVAILAIFLAVPVTIGPIVAPTGKSAIEWTEERDLLTLFMLVREDDGLWIASDLSDSAENHSRALRPVSLTSLVPAQFYISNVASGGYRWSDAPERMSEVWKFFGTNLTTWHEDFLRRRGIRFVLVSDRCPPKWSVDDFPASETFNSGAWTLLIVAESSRTTLEDNPSASETNSSWRPDLVNARYGKSSCLGDVPP